MTGKIISTPQPKHECRPEAHVGRVLIGSAWECHECDTIWIAHEHPLCRANVGQRVAHGTIVWRKEAWWERRKRVKEARS